MPLRIIGKTENEAPNVIIDTSTHLRKTVTCSALDFISLLVPHMPPKGMQMVRYAGLYARSIKRRCAEVAHTALEVLRTQLPLFA